MCQSLCWYAARAFAAALIIQGIFSPTKLLAEVSRSLVSLERTGPSREPFGSSTEMLSSGGLRDKWMRVNSLIANDQRILDACRADRDQCEDPEALRLLALVDTARTRNGIARLGEINRAVNLAIKPKSDMANHGVLDFWSSPLATLARGSGDCEDYAIVKFVALKEAGIPLQDLRLVIVRDEMRVEDHAMIAVAIDGRWLMLDNRRFVMLSDHELKDSHPTFVIGEAGVRAYPENARTVQRHTALDLDERHDRIAAPDF